MDVWIKPYSIQWFRKCMLFHWISLIKKMFRFKSIARLYVMRKPSIRRIWSRASRGQWLTWDIPYFDFFSVDLEDLGHTMRSGQYEFLSRHVQGLSTGVCMITTKSEVFWTLRQCNVSGVIQDMRVRVTVSVRCVMWELKWSSPRANSRKGIDINWGEPAAWNLENGSIFDQNLSWSSWQ